MRLSPQFLLRKMVVLPEWFDQLGLMGWPLALCAIIALAIGFERTVFCINMHIRREKQYQTLSDFLIQHKHQPKRVRDDAMEVMLSELQGAYRSGIKGLHIIGVISPMLGFLGTILGIIAAFKAISVQTGPVSPNLIAQGLWEAMLTTAAGLLIALPVLLMVYVFQYFSERQLRDFCLRLNKLSVMFELEQGVQRSVVTKAPHTTP